MKNLNPFSFKYEQELIGFDPANPFGEIDGNQLDRALKRVFFKHCAQAAIGAAAGIAIRVALKKAFGLK